MSVRAALQTCAVLWSTKYFYYCYYCISFFSRSASNFPLFGQKWPHLVENNHPETAFKLCSQYSLDLRRGRSDLLTVFSPNVDVGYKSSLQHRFVWRSQINKI